MTVLREGRASAVRAIAVFLIATSHTSALASDGESALDKVAKWRPYCGVYCAYAAIKMSGKSVQFQDLLRPEYIQSRKGSSMEDLGKAIHDLGLHATALGGMTVQTLQHCPHLMILHVKPSLKGQEYTHYVLCYSVGKKGVQVLDPPYSTRFIPFQELAALWDGRVLAISDGPISRQLVFASHRIRWIVAVATVLCIVVLVRYSIAKCPTRQTPSPSWTGSVVSSFCHATILGVLAVSGASLFHLWQGQGLLANGGVVHAIQESHAGDFLHKIGPHECHKLITNGAILIDARFAPDYQAGHIDGAISLPVMRSAKRSQRRLRRIPRSWSTARARDANLLRPSLCDSRAMGSRTSSSIAAGGSTGSPQIARWSKRADHEDE
jgi:predicted double-glycine peptidase